MAERPGMIVVAGVAEYHLRLISGAASVFHEHGVPLVVFAGHPSQPRSANLLRHLLRQHPPCGVITSPGINAEEDETLAGLIDSLHIPAVHIGQQRPDAANIFGDPARGMRELMAHLLDERGVRRPVLIRGVEHQRDSVTREQAFRAELADRGLVFDEELLVNGQFTHDHSFRGMRSLLALRRDMDAVVALNDVSAFGAIDALRDAALRVPEDVLVSGFDDEFAAAYRWPGLTSVNQDVEGQASRAAAMLIAQFGRPGLRGDVAVPSHLVVRGSTGGGSMWTGGRLANAMDANEFLRTQLAMQDTLVVSSRALSRCRTVDDVAAAFGSCLGPLGITGCRLAVYDPPPDLYSRNGFGEQARLLVDYRDRDCKPPPDEPQPVTVLLDGMRPEAGGAPTVLMPLSGLDRDLGFLLFRQPERSGALIEVVRHDLSRALDSAFSAEERDRYTADLERLVAQRTRKLQQANSELERMARLDGLTRIANRGAFEQHLDHQWALHTHSGLELALLLVDVDMFKKYNDNYGHVRGDETLRTVASCLAHSVCRPDDLAARYGGEEFALLLPGSNLRAARLVAHRFRHELAQAAIPHTASPVAPVITASIGIATTRACTGDTALALVRAADRALYEAKNAGRNRVAVNPSDLAASDGTG